MFHQNTPYKASPATLCSFSMAIVCKLYFGWWSRLFQPSVSKMGLLLCSPKHSVILRPRDFNVASIIIFKLMGMKIGTTCMIYSLIFNSCMFLRNCLQLIMLLSSVATTYKLLQVLSHAGWLDQNRASATFHRGPSGISLLDAGNCMLMPTIWEKAPPVALPTGSVFPP